MRAHGTGLGRTDHGGRVSWDRRRTEVLQFHVPPTGEEARSNTLSVFSEPGKLWRWNAYSCDHCTHALTPDTFFGAGGEESRPFTGPQADAGATTTLRRREVVGFGRDGLTTEPVWLNFVFKRKSNGRYLGQTSQTTPSTGTAYNKARPTPSGLWLKTAFNSGSSGIWACTGADAIRRIPSPRNQPLSASGDRSAGRGAPALRQGSPRRAPDPRTDTDRQAWHRPEPAPAALKGTEPG